MEQCWGRVGQGQGGTREQIWGVQAVLMLTWEQVQDRHRDFPWLWVTAPSSLSPRPEEG